MNIRKTLIIIKREYLNKVKKKSFLLITFLSPILFAALCTLPTIIMMATKEEAKKVAVVDASGIVLPYLENSEAITYFDCSGQPLDSLKNNIASSGYDAVLSISELDTEKKILSSDLYSVKPMGMEASQLISGRINDAVEKYRIASYNIPGLDKILEDVKCDIKLRSYTMDEDGKESISESGVYMAVSMALGIIIYMFIVMFGGMVMSSVIEEKASRVVEVLVSSVKATELMFGKIIGIAFVALTQFLLWILLTGAILGIVGAIAGTSFLGGADSHEIMDMASMGMDQSTAVLAQAVNEPGALDVIMGTLKNINFVELGVCFVLFFVFGYMLYASLFAAIGSAVENEADTQQLQIPITIPIMLGFFVALYAFKAPDSTIVFWASMIPFTSPIVMLARLPFGVPGWEIVLSIVLLILTFVLFAWLSAKIYKVGILMFGKKTSWKDLWRWLKMK